MYCSTAAWILCPTVVTRSAFFLSALILFDFKKSPYCVVLIESIVELGMRFNCFLPVRGTLLHDTMIHAIARKKHAVAVCRIWLCIIMSPYVMVIV